MFGISGPTSFTLYHEPGTDTAGHRCGPRLLARCAQCAARVAHCNPTPETIRRTITLTWLCSMCEPAPDQV